MKYWRMGLKIQPADIRTKLKFEEVWVVLWAEFSRLVALKKVDERIKNYSRRLNRWGLD